MADRLTAAELALYSDRNLRTKVTRTLTMDSDSISSTDVTEYVRKWGSLKTEAYNRHPKERGNFVLPVITVEADNTEKVFSPGGRLLPGGRSDWASMKATLKIEIGSRTLVDFTGQVLEPQYDPTGIIELVIEHPLTAMTSRRWFRADRIGGDTGINYFFDS